MIDPVSLTVLAKLVGSGLGYASIRKGTKESLKAVSFFIEEMDEKFKSNDPLKIAFNQLVSGKLDDSITQYHNAKRKHGNIKEVRVLRESILFEIDESIEKSSQYSNDFIGKTITQQNIVYLNGLKKNII